jgi:hypothetical protein
VRDPGAEAGVQWAMNRPMHTGRGVLLNGLIGLLTLSGCAKEKSDPTPSTVDAETAARLQLTEDAKDPTLRDNEAGYNRWRPKPEPEGTAPPMSPSRRKIDRRP